MSRRRRALVAGGILLLGAFLAAGWSKPGVQDTAKPSLKPAAAGLEEPAAARPAREQMATYVVLAWVWLSIGVLLGILRMKVREADRVHRIGLHREPERPFEEPGR